jgi:hypothetical protein
VAISQESYGRGKPVYDGSFAPTQGTVDPSGYIDRSLNNPSDSRSGLAQAALNKLRSSGSSGSGSVPVPISGVLPLGDIKTLTITPTGQLIPDNGIPETPPVSSPVGSAGAGTNGLAPLPSLSTGALSPMAQAAFTRLLSKGSPVGA